jgi:hypothetical protein
MEFFLRPENAPIWSEVQTLAQKGDDSAIAGYVTEAQRLTSTQRNVRVATQPTTIDGTSISPGNLVVLLLGEAGRHSSEITNATTFDPRRKAQADGVSAFSFGKHHCFAKEIAPTFLTALVKLVAGLKSLRPAPGDMGKVKTIRVGTEKAYLNDSWSYLAFDASSKFFLVWGGWERCLTKRSVESAFQWVRQGRV